jgi:isochorismate synthase EntC
MTRDFAFIQIAAGRIFVGWGPFEQLPFRRPGVPAFFVTDFFLDEARPWRHPSRWEEMSIPELASRFEPQTIEVNWTSTSDFRTFFDSARTSIERGEFKKIVPVVFDSGSLRNDPWNHFLEHLDELPRGLWAYGWSLGGRNVAGATPEVLFQTHGRGYSTMALAGTRPLPRAEELLRDRKELREHRFVVDDIARRLAPFGNIEIGALGIMRLPGISHLITPIFFAESGDDRMTFSEMIRRLHPTAALGVWPRNEAGERWLRESDRLAPRGAFGAPFGLELDDHFALALVGIRNAEWSVDGMRIGSGAGLLAESGFEQELDELRQKREQVKALFGIRTAVESLT